MADDVKYVSKNWEHPKNEQNIPVKMVDNVDGTFSEAVVMLAMGTVEDAKNTNPDDPSGVIALLKGLIQLQIDANALLTEIRDLLTPL